MTDTTWWRAEFFTPSGELLSAALFGEGAQGVEVYDQETFFDDDPSWVPVPDGVTRLVAYFEPEDPVSHRAALERLVRAHAGSSIVAYAVFEDTSWQGKWREFFHPRPLSTRSVVGPPWEDIEAPEHGVRVIIEPSIAFGTGTHETTQLVAGFTDELLGSNPGRSVLDVGCGSGILSILAHSLGARRVRGIDIDAGALKNARDNLAHNGLERDAITLDTTPVGAIEDTYDLVLANILAHILLKLRDDLIARVAPGGALILCGLLTSERGALEAAFAEGGMRVAEARTMGEWCALHMVSER
ncbi:MAG: 50S ribosomal protein L11 methyltransferase [Myxococcota bacterium]